MNEEAVRKGFFALELFEHRLEPRSKGAVRIVALGASPLERLPEPLVPDRFEEIVERVDLECPEREAVVCRHKNDSRQRKLCGRKCLNHGKAVDARHLDI